MDLRESASEGAFRVDVRKWLESNLAGKFAEARGLGGPGREHEAFEVRAEWERHLAAAGWTCLGWPEEHGGRGFDLRRQVIFHEEYARSDAPVRVGLIGEGMVGPTLIAFGTEEQKARLLPPIQRGEELWCQLYSEPNAGSDLANVATKAERDGDDYVITGQKVWTSLAHWADWGFAIVRTEAGSKRHRGLSYLLVPDARSPASRCARSSRRPARRSSTRSSSTAPARRSTISSAPKATAGRSAWRRSASSAVR